jgi:FkbM family methyltransferase
MRATPPGRLQRAVQALLMLAYRGVQRSGVLNLPAMRQAFEAAYRAYKHGVEAPYVDALEPYVGRGTLAVDVGANIGFFTTYFAQWTGSKGCVLAIEPEAANFARLRATIAASGLERRVVPVHAAAAEAQGTVNLAVDPVHPGGHHLAAGGLPTPCVAVDDLVRARPALSVSFIKIDVQGAELRVLLGAQATLAAHRPALLVELDERALRAQGASVAAVVDLLYGQGYRGRFVMPRLSRPFERPRLVEECLRHDYVDVLFLHGDGQ